MNKLKNKGTHETTSEQMKKYIYARNDLKVMNRNEEYTNRILNEHTK